LRPFFCHRATSLGLFFMASRPCLSKSVLNLLKSRLTYLIQVFRYQLLLKLYKAKQQ
jgi:hypothetical protein